MLCLLRWVHLTFPMFYMSRTAAACLTTNTVQLQCENLHSVFTPHYYTSCHFIEKAHLREDCFTYTFEMYFIYILNVLSKRGKKKKKYHTCGLQKNYKLQNASLCRMPSFNELASCILLAPKSSVSMTTSEWMTFKLKYWVQTLKYKESCIFGNYTYSGKQKHNVTYFQWDDAESCNWYSPCQNACCLRQHEEALSYCSAGLMSMRARVVVVNIVIYRIKKQSTENLNKWSWWNHV